MYVNNDINYLKFLRGKEVIIFGGGKLGQKTFTKLNKGVEGLKVTAFCDNDEKKQGEFLMGIEVISMEKLCKINNLNTMIVICSRFEREIKEQLLAEKIFNFISESQIDFGGGEEYYDSQYFEWQQRLGSFGGKISAFMFQPYIKEDATVVELGSGGGFLLNNIVAKEKVGIEINDRAREAARKMGIQSVKWVKEIPDNYADVIISTHVLEHVENPLGILRELHGKLKDDGKIIFYVPNESCETEYSRSEVNNHIYTWNCLTLGNLFKAAGFFVRSVKKVQESWPDNYEKIEQEVSLELFEALCNIGGKAFDKNNCMIIADK